MKVTTASKAVLLGTAAAIALLPLAAGSASASDFRPSNRYQISTPGFVLTPAQATAITAARGAYRTSAAQGKAALESALATIRVGLDSTVAPQREAVLNARDAYLVAVEFGGDVTGTRAALDAALADCRTALKTAQAAAWTQAAAARANADAALTAARNAYVAAVTAQFPAGTVIPQRLLMPPRVQLGDVYPTYGDDEDSLYGDDEDSRYGDHEDSGYVSSLQDHHVEADD